MKPYQTTSWGKLAADNQIESIKSRAMVELIFNEKKNLLLLPTFQPFRPGRSFDIHSILMLGITAGTIIHKNKKINI